VGGGEEKSVCVRILRIIFSPPNYLCSHGLHLLEEGRLPRVRLDGADALVLFWICLCCFGGVLVGGFFLLLCLFW
jgi:hypothetical protein